MIAIGDAMLCVCLSFILAKKNSGVIGTWNILKINEYTYNTAVSHLLQ